MLPHTAASNTPYTITVSSDKYGEASSSDVMFRDVWICNGQSNMHYPVSKVATSYIQNPINGPAFLNYRNLVGKMK